MPILPLNQDSLVPLSTVLKQTTLKEAVEHIDISPEVETSGQSVFVSLGKQHTHHTFVKILKRDHTRLENLGYQTID